MKSLVIKLGDQMTVYQGIEICREYVTVNHEKEAW